MLTKIEKCPKVLPNITQNDTVDISSDILVHPSQNALCIDNILPTGTFLYCIWKWGSEPNNVHGYIKNTLLPIIFSFFRALRRSLLEIHIFTQFLYLDTTLEDYPHTTNAQRIVNILLHFHISCLGLRISQQKKPTHFPILMAPRGSHSIPE